MTDVGKSLFCRVTATNAAGSASADSNTVGPVTAGVSYTGPGDVVAGATVWWGMRAYSAATRGTNCIRLVRASDSTQQDFVTLADGSLDVASIATFLASTTGKVVTIYDQSGNGHHATQPTDASRPPFVLAATGTRPAMQGNGAVSLSTGAFTTMRPGPRTTTIPQPYTVSAVVVRTGAFTTAGAWLGATSGMSCYFFSTVNTVTFYAGVGGTNATAADSAWHTIQEIFNGASSEIYVDGAYRCDRRSGCGKFSA